MHLAGIELLSAEILGLTESLLQTNPGTLRTGGGYNVGGTPITPGADEYLGFLGLLELFLDILIY
jgi:hypothetical protein